MVAKREADGKYYKPDGTLAPMCPACNKRQGYHHRGLCWPCWKNKKVRVKHDADPVHGQRHVDEDFEGPAGEAVPTVATPGTLEKRLILMKRVERKLELHAKCDLKHGDTPPAVVNVTENLPLPEKIIYLRTHHNMSQRKLAKAVKVNVSSVSRIESGARNPSLRLLRRLAAILKVKFWLLLNVPEPKPAEDIYINPIYG